jgi:hypothetical protein
MGEVKCFKCPTECNASEEESRKLLEEEKSRLRADELMPRVLYTVPRELFTALCSEHL